MICYENYLELKKCCCECVNIESTKQPTSRYILIVKVTFFSEIRRKVKRQTVVSDSHIEARLVLRYISHIYMCGMSSNVFTEFTVMM